MGQDSSSCRNFVLYSRSKSILEASNMALNYIRCIILLLLTIPHLEWLQHGLAQTRDAHNKLNLEIQDLLRTL